MDLQTADKIANRLVERMRPHCQRVEIAGSVRRRQREVGDIEIVAVPKTYTAKVSKSQGSLFGEQFDLVERSQLVDECLAHLPSVKWIKATASVELGGDGGSIEDLAALDMTAELSREKHFGAGRLYWKGASMYQGKPFQIDIFLTDRDRFGATFVIRTGSYLFNINLITALKKRGYGFHNGDFVRYESGCESVADVIYCPEEVVIFKQLGIPVPDHKVRDERYNFN